MHWIIRILLKKNVKTFINRLFKGNLSVFANALCDSGLTKEEITELKKLLGRDD